MEVAISTSNNVHCTKNWEEKRKTEKVQKSDSGDLNNANFSDFRKRMKVYISFEMSCKSS